MIIQVKLEAVILSDKVGSFAVIDGVVLKDKIVCC